MNSWQLFKRKAVDIGSNACMSYKCNFWDMVPHFWVGLNQFGKTIFLIINFNKLPTVNLSLSLSPSPSLPPSLLSLLVANKFKLALVQLSVGGDKAANLQRAVKLVCEAAGNGANIIALPECFNSPYGTSYFPAYCEPIPGESTECLSRVAKETKAYIIGGTCVHSI